jgi:hypothetical protein
MKTSIKNGHKVNVWRKRNGSYLARMTPYQWQIIRQSDGKQVARGEAETEEAAEKAAEKSLGSLTPT